MRSQLVGREGGQMALNGRIKSRPTHFGHVRVACPRPEDTVHVEQFQPAYVVGEPSTKSDGAKPSARRLALIHLCRQLGQVKVQPFIVCQLHDQVS